ncbi:hypothetical protein L1987_02157 [Smallanthus sonchifolius]|uniref:Uncharacterized protein n=1 Tax=Smallanthus sonchifolius TaxID=185202 RepID=A0ACB9K701_9ASTR|nr:hypothetical protein L1987_02157 [Smallanthus sonchifolius]
MAPLLAEGEIGDAPDQIGRNQLGLSGGGDDLRCEKFVRKGRRINHMSNFVEEEDLGSLLNSASALVDGRGRDSWSRAGRQGNGGWKERKGRSQVEW